MPSLRSSATNLTNLNPNNLSVIGSAEQFFKRGVLHENPDISNGLGWRNICRHWMKNLLDDFNLWFFPLFSYDSFYSNSLLIILHFLLRLLSVHNVKKLLYSTFCIANNRIWERYILQICPYRRCACRSLSAVVFFSPEYELRNDAYLFKGSLCIRWSLNWQKRSQYQGILNLNFCWPRVAGSLPGGLSGRLLAAPVLYPVEGGG